MRREDNKTFGLYMALLPFIFFSDDEVLRFEYCSIYMLADDSRGTVEGLRLNALKKIDFDGNWRGPQEGKL